MCNLNDVRSTQKQKNRYFISGTCDTNLSFTNILKEERNNAICNLTYDLVLS